ncbi:MAG: hypothetical protein AB8G23_04100 [Myxococcota bacterium]
MSRRMLRKTQLMPWIGLLILDALFLRWVGWHFGNWGFWDWDYQQSLLEATRISLLEFGQLPLWNPYLGGGVPLAGNSLSHGFAPSILPVLLFGTIPGIKIVIAVYLLLSQIGMRRLAIVRGQSGAAPWLAAIVFSLGGVYAQRLTHGHFEWIAMAWMPLILAMLHPSPQLSRPFRIALGGLFYAFLFLDGGPYQFAFFTLFAAAYSAVLAATERKSAPLLELLAVGLLGAGIAALKLLPVLDVVSRFPRKTAAINFYGAPFEPTALQILSQMWVSTAQAHDPEMWMPFVLNVGTYVGWSVLALATLSLVPRPKTALPLIGLACVFLWIALGPAAPFDLWERLHALPFFSALRVPTRFNVFVLLLVALLAGQGLSSLEDWIRTRFLPGSAGAPARVTFLIVGLVGLELALINGALFRVAFSVPPIEIETARASPDFQHLTRSPFLPRYKETALYPVHPNWPGAAFPVILSNRGVLRTYRTIGLPSRALAKTSPIYRGEAFMTGEPREVIRRFDWSPNRLHIETDGRAGKIILNQNFDPGWRVETAVLAPPSSDRGRLALNVGEGIRKIELSYRPAPFLAGAAVSAASTLLFFILIFRARRARSFVLK